jgi:hypothetical protein
MSIVLVVHSERDSEIKPCNNVTIVEQFHKGLSFADAQKYFKTGQPNTEYSSAAVGLCHPLNDSTYESLFGTKPNDKVIFPFVFTGKYVKNESAKKRIYVLRGMCASLDEISKLARYAKENIILVSCRSDISQEE